MLCKIQVMFFPNLGSISSNKLELDRWKLMRTNMEHKVMLDSDLCGKDSLMISTKTAMSEVLVFQTCHWNITPLHVVFKGK